MNDIHKLVTELTATKAAIEALAAAYHAAKDELDTIGPDAAELGRVTYYANGLALEKVDAALAALTANS